MGCLPVFEGLGSKVERLDNFLPLFQEGGMSRGVVGERERGGEGGFLIEGKALAHILPLL